MSKAFNTEEKPVQYFQLTMKIDKSLKKKFDLVMYANSLEHIYALKESLNYAKKLLKTDGYLYIEVPDTEQYCNINSSPSPFMMLTYEHLYHFTCNTMKNISALLKMELIRLDNKKRKCNGFYIIRGLYKNNNKSSQYIYDKSSQEAISKYINFSHQNLKNIKMYEKSQKKLILWGIGASTALFLNNTFDNCNVIQLIDRNPARQNIEYKVGNKYFTIEDPSKIKDSEATILTMSYWYHDSIKKQIEEMGLKNKIDSLKGDFNE